MSTGHDLDKNTALVIGHFDAFVNDKDLDAMDRNLDAGFVDHDGPGGRVVDRAADRANDGKDAPVVPRPARDREGLGRPGRQGRRSQRVGRHECRDRATHGVPRFRHVAHRQGKDRGTLGHGHADARDHRPVPGVVGVPDRTVALG